MEEAIIQATVDALRSVEHVRFFNSERGYQGRFFCALQAALDEFGILVDEIVLEMEYQKTADVHGTRQRPDIVLHVPREVSGAPPYKHNVAVWALKRQANATAAQEDFGKLDVMFGKLNYPLGFFVNIDCERHHLDEYVGNYRGRVQAFAVWLGNEGVCIKWARWMGDRMDEVQL